jgi:hypothetical protein
MKHYHLTIGIALVLLLAGAIGGIQAKNQNDTKTKNVSCTGSGTFADGVDTHIDTNHDGVSAGLNQGLENCTIGRFIFHFEGEYVGPVTPPTTCQGTQEEFQLVQAHAVATEEKTSDQLFIEDAAGGVTLCLNPDGTFSFTEHGTFTGGTGQFTGASGTLDGQGTGKYLIVGVDENGVFTGGFGQFNFTESWTLTLPKGEN